MYVYRPDIHGSSADFTLITPRCLNSLSQSHLPGEDAADFLQLKPFTQHQIFVPPGTHYCWVDEGDVDSKLIRGFYTWLALRESNQRPLNLGSSALTLRPRAPQSDENDTYLPLRNAARVSSVRVSSAAHVTYMASGVVPLYMLII